MQQVGLWLSALKQSVRSSGLGHADSRSPRCDAALLSSPVTPFRSNFYIRSALKGLWSTASDVALRLPYSLPTPHAADGPVRVGINVSGLLMNGGYSGANMFGLSVDYADLMRRIVTRFATEVNCEVHLVAHVISDVMPIEDDWRVSESLVKNLADVAKDRIVLAPRFASPSEAKSYIAGLDFFIGARMHA